MRAVEYDRFGPVEVLEVRDRPRPAPGRGELLIRVRAAAINPKDVYLREGRPPYPLLAGRRFPRATGYDWAGEVAALGAGVRGFAVGDRAFGMIGAWSAGACAEYAVVRADETAPAPAGRPWDEIAALPLAGLTALQALRDVARLATGQHVLVNGASGGVGVLAVQIAQALGARVTTATSERNLELARSLGAEAALDYQRDPLDRRAPYDVVFDVFGNLRPADTRAWLTRRGVHVATVPRRVVLRAIVLTLWRSPRVRLVRVHPSAADLKVLAAWSEQGSVRAVVDQVLPLDRIRDAHARVASHRARGKVVVVP